MFFAKTVVVWYTGQGAEGPRYVFGIRKSVREVLQKRSSYPRTGQSDHVLTSRDDRDRKDLGVLLEDTNTETGLIDTWENVQDIVALSQCNPHTT